MTRRLRAAEAAYWRTMTPTSRPGVYTCSACGWTCHGDGQDYFHGETEELGAPWHTAMDCPAVRRLEDARVAHTAGAEA